MGGLRKDVEGLVWKDWSGRIENRLSASNLDIHLGQKRAGRDLSSSATMWGQMTAPAKRAFAL